MDFASYIRDVRDFPKRGIVFKDITPLLKDAEAFGESVEELAYRFDDAEVDYVAAVESRGFIFGAAVAVQLTAGFIPLRKPKKLPYKTVRETYQLEYGSDALEVHEDACGPGDRVLIVDDLLATGGTVAAARKLIQKLGAEPVGAGFIVELDFLKGRNKLEGLWIESLIHYASE